MARKLEKWIWFIIKILPFIALIFYFMYGYAMAWSNPDFDYYNMFQSLFNSVGSAFEVLPIYNPLLSLYYNFSGVAAINVSYILRFIFRYMSYLIFIETFKIAYETLIFLPKFIGNLFERKMKDE